MPNAIRVLEATFVLGLGFGCSMTDVADDRLTPTHRWLADADVSVARYNLHNKQCVDEANIDARGMRQTTPEFSAYEQCMNAKGYTLVAAAH